MENPDSSLYCRLCAELKPQSKLINLDTEDHKRTEITEKLARFGVPSSVILRELILPKTVCLICVNTLESAIEFIKSIEKAQEILNNIILCQQIKKESQNTDDHNFAYESLPENVKSEETVEIKQESSFTDTKINLNVKIQIPNIKKRKKGNGLDAIPLSQLKLTWQDYNWLCSHCGTQFPTVDELVDHSMAQHGCCNAYRCPDCNIRKLNLDSFLIHVKRHKKYLKLSCYKCHSKFPTPRKVNMHTKTHIMSEHVCGGCNKSYNTSEELSTHKNVYFMGKRTRNIPTFDQHTEHNLTCILCKKSFKNKSGLNTHLLTHTERTRDHTCEKCGSCFYSKHTLADHMLMHEDEKPHQCEICKRCFKRAAQLRRHVGIHDNKKPFSCEQCGRCFRLQEQLKSHVIIHTDLLPHVCTFCNKAFRFRTILNQHIRQHTGIKPYACEICLRDFTNWPNYNKHMKRRHGMEVAKKKHTPEGVYQINPATGEIIIHEQTDKMVEWKKQILAHKKLGRPKNNQDGQVRVSC